MKRLFLFTLSGNVIFPLLILAFFSACSQDYQSGIVYEKQGHRFPYDLTKPAKSWKLPASLTEISGISCIDEHRLACIQDEKGIIFIFNMNDEKIEKEIVFGEDGDYEDIVIIGDYAWVLKSNGTLYEVSDFLKEGSIRTKKYATALSKENDAEGLAYDVKTNSLLIACKEKPFTDGTVDKFRKAIYNFNMGTKSMAVTPRILISPDSLKGVSKFGPSGIAVHPQTGDLYVIASVGKSLLVLSDDGALLSQAKLSPVQFPQPEGICFGPGGELYISSEGNGGAGRILRFGL